MTPEATLQSLAQHLRAKFEGAHIPRQVYLLPEIPRNQNGKVERQKLAEAVRGQQAINLRAMA